MISDRELLRQLLFNSNDFHLHPGCIDENSLFSPNNLILTDEENGSGSYLVLKPSGNGCYWIHAFGQTNDSDKVDLKDYLCFIKEYAQNILKLYAISDDFRLYSQATANGFQQIDKIVEFAASRDQLSRRCIFTHPIRKIEAAKLPEILENCETAFPIVWRNSFDEIKESFVYSNFAYSIEIDKKTAAYLLAAVDGTNCHIMRMAVSQEYQNQHLASELIAYLIATSKESEFSVNTFERNTPAVALYKKFGFSLIDYSLPVLEKRLIH